MPDLFGSTMGGDPAGLRQIYGIQNRYDYSHLSPELAQAERTQDQRQLVANAIMQGALKPRQGKMVGRLYQKAHIGEGLGQIGEALIGGWMQGDIEKKRGIAEKDEQKRVEDAIMQFMEKTQGRTVEAHELPGRTTDPITASDLGSAINENQPQEVQGPPKPIDTPMRTVEPGRIENIVRQAGPVGNYLADNLAPSGRYAPGDDIFKNPAEQISEAIGRFGSNVPPKPPLYAQRYEEAAAPSQAIQGPVNPELFIPPTEQSKQQAYIEGMANPNAQVRQSIRHFVDMREKASEVTYHDLGDKVAVMRKGQMIGYLPKGAAPKGITYVSAGGTLVPTDEQGVTGGPPIVKTLTPGEKTDANNQIVLIDPTTGQPTLNIPYVGARKDIANAGANNIRVNNQNFEPANTEAQKAFMRNAAEQYKLLSGVSATLKNLDDAKALIPGAKDFMGTGGPQILNIVKFFNNRLGTAIDIKGITNAEELRSRLFNNILNDLKKLDAQPSQQQQNTLSDALGNLTTDPNGLPKVLDAYEDILRSKVSTYNDMIDSSQTRGVRFPYDAHIVIPPPGFADTGNKDENGNMIVRKRGVNGGKDEYQVYQRGK